ncbi:hypothetical protein VMT65_02440 [Nocardia sp. CDC153]|uniref:hypothetical protein n=1 Tax=Nocardia sp. CDC153 TaxID=3112167 RepID=UPI002DC04296|nr:hypothetical protein [Nocardia sp. CDC153]MEC3951884.1 hypothetical protein [Nocardia sp. CDC153]
MNNIRRFGLSAAGIAAISATVALTAPLAAADTASNGMTVVGSNFTTGNAYTINILTGVTGVTANVYDTVNGSNALVGSATSTDSAQASVQWTPTTAGSHHLWVVLTGGSQSVPTSGPVDITVADASTSTTGTGSASSLFPLIANLLGSLAGGNGASVG